MAFNFNNLSDERLAELSTAVYEERRKRFFSRNMEINDRADLPRLERVKWVRENNPGLDLTEAWWWVESNVA